MTPFPSVFLPWQFSVPNLLTLGHLRFVRPPTREAFVVCERPTYLRFTAVLARFGLAPFFRPCHMSPPVLITSDPLLRCRPNR